MPSINKNPVFSDRGGTVGKGDLSRSKDSKFRDGIYWKRSRCCNFKVKDRDGYPGKYLCRCCFKPCEIKP